MTTDELKKLAEAATPGPWHVVYYDAGDKPHRDHNGPCPGIFASEELDCAIIHWEGFKQEYWSSANGSQKQIQTNAELIAAANPAAILKLLAINAELVEALKEISADYADRFDLESPSTNPGIKLSIALARAALAKAEGGEL